MNRDFGDGAYYLEGDLADLELDLVEHFCDSCNSHGYQQMAGSEIVKTLVVEGCGIDFEDPNKVQISFK